MDLLNYIMPPLVGAVIGYFTNYIAVKMLFRPLKPIKICGKTLPFTPGIIPKGKPRLAKALGQAVGKNLFTENDIKNILLSESMQNSISEYAENFVKNSQTIKESAENTMSPEKYSEIRNNICQILTDKIIESAESSDIGSIIAEKGGDAVREKVAGTMLTMFIKDDLIDSLCGSIGNKVNEYISSNGKEIVEPIVEAEAEKLENKSFGTLLEETGIEAEKVTNSVKKIYVKFIEENSEKFIKHFNISEIVEEKVNEMDVLMLEDLLMSIMKKELNAVVNLGAVIGLVIGTINIFF